MPLKRIFAKPRQKINPLFLKSTNCFLFVLIIIQKYINYTYFGKYVHLASLNCPPFSSKSMPNAFKTFLYRTIKGTTNQIRYFRLISKQILQERFHFYKIIESLFVFLGLLIAITEWRDRAEALVNMSIAFVDTASSLKHIHS